MLTHFRTVAGWLRRRFTPVMSPDAAIKVGAKSFCPRLQTPWHFGPSPKTRGEKSFSMYSSRFRRGPRAWLGRHGRVHHGVRHARLSAVRRAEGPACTHTRAGGAGQRPHAGARGSLLKRGLRRLQIDARRRRRQVDSQVMSWAQEISRGPEPALRARAAGARVRKIALDSRGFRLVSSTTRAWRDAC